MTRSTTASWIPRRSSEHTFEDVLFTDDTETPVNVLTGETPAHSQATVEEAKEFAASIATETPQIALPASVESQVETQGKPYTAAAFFHFKATGSFARHRAYDGPTIFLYTEHGTGIRHRGQLDRLLEESEELWIVPADVHF